jgi:hypothetical protein
MKTLLFLLSLSLGSYSVLADETVTVEGSRIWPDSGPVTSVSNPGGRHPCVDPTCGGRIDRPEPGGSADATTSLASKNTQNTRNKAKAKASIDDIKDIIKSTEDIVKVLKSWLTGLLQIHYDDTTIIRYPDGTRTAKGKCFDLSLELGSRQPGEHSPCTEIKGEPEQVRQANGTIQNQLRLTYTLYYACYYERKCGPKTISFIAGNEKELTDILNEVIGENFF